MVGSKRRFNILDSTDEIAGMLMAFYEAHLNQQENNGDSVHEYTSDMLHQFFDDYLGELCCLVRQDNNLWIPYPKDWIKEQCIFMYVRKQFKAQSNNDMEVDQ